MKKILWTLSSLGLLISPFSALAEPTEVVVRVLSKGAKFVGSDVGGARITIKELAGGKVLAQGKTEGTTGDTDRIMRRAHAVGEPRSDGGSAKFAATLDLDKPVYAEIRARGPMGHEASANEASVTMWLLPGKHLRQGDAVLLEMPPKGEYEIEVRGFDQAFGNTGLGRGKLSSP